MLFLDILILVAMPYQGGAHIGFPMERNDGRSVDSPTCRRSEKGCEKFCNYACLSAYIEETGHADGACCRLDA
jgi:hypothetical protein